LVACYDVCDMVRPIARLALVLPSAVGSGGEAVERLGRGVADALATQGVITRLHTHNGVADGAPRADAAVWLCAHDGTTVTPDPRLVPARVHIGVVVDPASSERALGRYDALFVPCGHQEPAVREAVHKAARQVPVVAARLACLGPAREAEKAERGVVGRVIALDLRRGSLLATDLERTLVQLSLRSESGALVLVTDDDEGLQRRLRGMAERHGVSAFLASGPDAMTQAIGASDLVVGALAWHDLLLAASVRVAVVALPASAAGTPSLRLLTAMRDARVIEELSGTIQLAAALDRLLHDDGGLLTRGLAVEGALLQSPRELVQALGQVVPLAGTQTHVTHWETIGPQPATTTTSAPVDAVASAPKKTTAQRIEDDLAALKAKLASERTSP
jgi:hypothetical protein